MTVLRMTKAEKYIPVPLLGFAAEVNRRAVSWSSEKLLVLANGPEVYVVDTDTLEVVQVLTGHKENVAFVLWLPSGRQFAGAESKLSPRDVLSIDTTNQVIVWDALQGTQNSSFIHPETTRQVLDVCVPNGADLWARTKVYILYTGNFMVIFDHAHSSFQNVAVVHPSLDTLGLSDLLVRIAIDPHYANQSTNRIAFMALDNQQQTTASSVSICSQWDYVKDSRIVVHSRISLDSQVNKNNSGGLGNSSSNHSIGNISGGNASGGISRSTSGGNLSPSSFQSDNAAHDKVKRQSGSSASIRKLMSDIIVGPDYSSSPTHSHVPNNSVINGAIAFHPGMKDTLVVSTDSNIFLLNLQFNMVLHTFCFEKTVSPLAHCVPTKLRPCLVTLHENGTLYLRKYFMSGTHNASFQLESLASSDNPRFSGKKTEVYGCAVHPVEENVVIIYLSDGRLLKYELTGEEKTLLQQKIISKQHLTTPSTPFVRNIGFPEEPPFPGSSGDANPTLAKSPVKSIRHLVKPILESDSDLVMKLRLKRVTNTFGQFTCLKSRDELLVAGTSMGFLIVLKIINGKLKAIKKFTTHSSSPVNGIEFVSDSEVLSYSNLNFSTNPKCELILTEIWTGASRTLKSDENFHIQAVKISPLCQYFVVAYKGGSRPCELWDLPRRQLIKTLPNKLPPISCIYWRPPLEDTKEELFYMTDLGSFLFTFRVEGNRFLNATCVKLEHTAHIAGVPSALFSKGIYVYRADSNGVMVMYNTNKKTASPSVSIGRGPLLGIERVPVEEENYVVQFADNLTLWEFTGMKKIKPLHHGKLKTISFAVMKDWVVYISKNNNGIRLLPLDIDPDVCIKPSTIPRMKYPYFYDATEKAFRILTVCENKSTSVTDLVKLAREFGAGEEFKLWNIIGSKWNSDSNSHFVNGIDIFSDNQSYKEVLVKTAQCAWSVDYKKREEVGKILLWTGETERAAEILLDTEPSDSRCYVLNGLKASIGVGSNTLPEQTKAVLKIVATNLIACGETDSGLELLCLLQKHNEACKYVESTNEWSKAVLLCKTALNEKNAEDSLCKYAQCMNSRKCAFKAASVYAFVGKYDRTIEVLFGARLRHLSYMLLHFCERQGVQLNISDHIKLAIRLDFARFIFECGLQKEAISFCESLGDQGSDLKQELEILSS